MRKVYAIHILPRKRQLSGEGDRGIAVEGARKALAPKYGGWAGFSRMGAREVPLMAAELAGTKRVPVPEKAD